jgi:very-short-patch-repair endonuclease
MADSKTPTWKVSTRLRSHARALRQNSTDAERILWSELRANRLAGGSFRRQAPIENFIADFVCRAAKLVIELDGGQHFTDTQEIADARRSSVIEASGFRVLRFSNHDVMANRAGVLETIATVIAERAPTLTLTLTLPRKRGREPTGVVAKTADDKIVNAAPSPRRAALPPPLAGEGWGGGAAASEVTKAEQKRSSSGPSSKLRPHKGGGDEGTR